MIVDPTSLPYYPVQTYADGGAPEVLSDEFFNPVQDINALLYGGTTGQSCSLRREEFLLKTPNIVDTTGYFGQQMLISANSRFTVSVVSGGALAVGDHGVWKVAQTGVTDGTFVAEEASCWIGMRQVLVAAKVKLTRRAGFDTLANRGFEVGLVGSSGGLSFRTGSDVSNWYAWNGATATDSGVAANNGTWYWLIAARRGNAFYWYICTPGNVPVQVHTSGVTGALATLYRIARCKTTGGTAGDGFSIDALARITER